MQASAQACGVLLPDEPDPEVPVWPENFRTVQTFCALGTQWRIAAGMGGVAWLGLDYAAIPAVLRLTGVPRAEWPELFEGLRVMERAAAEVLNSKRG